MTYRELYQSWETDPEAFWMKAADHIDRDRAPVTHWMPARHRFMNGIRMRWSTPAIMQSTAM